MLAEIGDVALIVVDPITAYLGDTDSHKNADIRALLAPLSELAAKHGVAVLCVSHLNKSCDAKALMRVTGSVAFVAASRSAWLVTKDTEDRRLFLPLKNNVGSDRSGLAFAVVPAQVESPAAVIETSRVKWETEAVTITADEAVTRQGNAEKRSALEEAKEFLCELLADGPVSSDQVRDHAKGAGHSWAAIRRAQKALGIEPLKGGMKDGWAWNLPAEDAQ